MEKTMDATISMANNLLNAENTRHQEARHKKRAPMPDVVYKPYLDNKMVLRNVPGMNKMYTKLVNNTMWSGETLYN